MQTGTVTVENSMQFSLKIKYGTALWSSDSTSGNISEDTQNTNSKEYVHPYVFAALLKIAEIWKHLRFSSVDERI